MEQLKVIYEDPSQPGSFGGLEALYTEAKRTRIKVSRQNVKKWLIKRQSYTLHKPARRMFKRNKTLVIYKDELWQLDLCDMAQLKEYDDGNTFLLNVVDVFSKYGFAKPLLNKKGCIVLKALQEILTDSKRKPVNCQTDMGTEFTNRKFKHVLHNMSINYYVTFSENKAAVVERFNRTLKTNLWRFFTHSNSYRYMDVLPALLKGCNSSPHIGYKR